MRIASRREGVPISTVTRHARLRRDYPGERLLEERALAGRLHLRDRELRVFEGMVKVREQRDRGATRRPQRLPEAEPNAPLLIRIVRYPYRQETHRGRRRRLYDASRDRPATEVREQPMRSAMVFRGEPIYGNPIKALDIHPSPLPAPPSVDTWLSAVGVRPDLPAMPDPAQTDGGR